MSSSTRTQGALADLADQLLCEYAGALPPGQILALVFRANHLVSYQPSLDADVRLATVETVVRHLLTERLAALRHTPVVVPVPGAVPGSLTGSLTGSLPVQPVA